MATRWVRYVMPVLAEARKMARASEDDPVVIADLDEWDWPVLPTSELWTD